MNIQSIIAAVLAGASMISSCFFQDTANDTANNTETAPKAETAIVRFVDVGQGDCELISFSDGRNMLIDAGTTASEDTLPAYLNSLGIQKLDYIVATHPHEDHIGGLDAVINSFEIGEIYMPKATTNTKTYKDVLTAIKNKGLSINTATSGKIIIDEPTVKAEILAPVNSEYEDLNNYSAVVRLQYGNTSFMFTGDAESLSENEMMNKYPTSYFKSDVLKLGHHGSSTSTSQRFFDAVSPSYSIISCGKDNSYGHPHRETLQLLNNSNSAVYRTDTQGTITAVTDGNSITFSTEK